MVQRLSKPEINNQSDCQPNTARLAQLDKRQSAKCDVAGSKLDSRNMYKRDIDAGATAGATAAAADDDDNVSSSINQQSYSVNQFRVLLQRDGWKENNLPRTGTFFRHLIFESIVLSLGLSNFHGQKYQPRQSTSPCIFLLCHFCILVSMTIR